MRLKTGDVPHAKGGKCGAHSRRSGMPCRSPAMKNGRCRMHGGLSTGARTPEGKERCRRANWKHGRRSAEAVEMRRQASALLRECRAGIESLKHTILDGDHE